MYQQRRNILADIPQVTKILLIINVAVFLVNMVSHGYVNYFLTLWTPDTGRFSPYQIVTHMFAHGNFPHLLFNMFFGLYMFGRNMETYFGSKRFFTLYFVSGLVAAGLQLLIYSLQGTPGGMLGASGAIFGILAAFAMTFPNVELMIIFFPVPIKAKYLIAGVAAYELFAGLGSFKMDNIAHFAHIGGAIGGFLLAWYWKKNQFRPMN